MTDVPTTARIAADALALVARTPSGCSTRDAVTTRCTKSSLRATGAEMVNGYRSCLPIARLTRLRNVASGSQSARTSSMVASA